LEEGSIAYCRLLEERNVVYCRQYYWQLLEEGSIVNCKLLEERSIIYYRQPTYCIHCRQTIGGREYSVL